MAIFAVQLVLVLCAVCRVEHLAAHSALEASFVPFVSTGNSFLGGVHRLAALGALWVLSWLERHLGVVFWFLFFAGLAVEFGALTHALILFSNSGYCSDGGTKRREDRQEAWQGKSGFDLVLHAILVTYSRAEKWVHRF